MDGWKSIEVTLLVLAYICNNQEMTSCTWSNTTTTCYT